MNSRITAGSFSLAIGLVLVASAAVLAQTHIPMPLNNGPLTVSLLPPGTCSFTFSDDGGTAGTYSRQSGAGSVVTFLPSAAGNKIVIQFTAFETEEGFDALFVYDGTDISAPQIGSGAAALTGLPNPFSGGAGGWQGTVAPFNVAPNILRATAANTSGALTLAFDSDQSLNAAGWTAIVSEVPAGPCALLASGAMNISTPAGTCFANAQIPAPGIAPGGCAQTLDLQYRLNGGPAVTIPQPVPPVITMPDVPVGTHVITWQLVEPCAGGLAASTTQTLVVADNTPPVLSAPANVVLDLLPGACSAIYMYAVTAQDDCAFAQTSSQPEQIQGLPSGSKFPLGTTVNVFKSTDLSGNTATASFSVTVNQYATPSSTLLCASAVNISLGPDCATTLGADDLLLGGPYRCYDTYTVQIDKIPPFTDGPWVPAVLTSADLGKTYGVRVSNPVNNNFCLSNVLVEDKLPPVLTGADVDLPCNFNTAPTHGSPVSMLEDFLPTDTFPISISDYETAQLTIPVAAPPDAQVDDLDVYLRVEGDVFEKNLHIELEGPDGTIAVLWNRQAGCSGPLRVYFDDEAAAGTGCSQYTDNMHARIPPGGGALAVFYGKLLSGAWKLRVRDRNGFDHSASIIEAFLQVRYTATFSAGFPNGLTFPGQITQISPTGFVVPAPLLDGCSVVALSYTDETMVQPCSSDVTTIIKRTWTAKDAANNSTSWIQTINLIRPDLDDVALPPNYDDMAVPAFECGSPYPSPAWIESQGKQGAPYVFGRPIGCSINWSYTDAVVHLCGGGYTINRNWTVVDPCKSKSIQFTQSIQVLDRQAPQLACPANLSVSTDLYTCCATINLPDVVADDACSGMTDLSAKVVVFNQYTNDTVQVQTVGGTLTTFPGNNPADPDTLAAFGVTACLPVGTHHVYYRVDDACGNTATCSFRLSVRDYTPPVAVGRQLTVISLSSDDLNDCYEPDPAKGQFAGVVTVPATVFDEGSYDNCNFIKMTVQRRQPYSPVIQALNSQNGAPPCFDGFPDLKSEYAKATGEADSIKFYCAEAGSTQTLILRCYQLDALGNFSLGANGQPIFNEAQVQVQVQDKLKPGCQPPADVAVTCENFDPGLEPYGLPTLMDNCCLDTTKIYQGQYGLTSVLDLSQFDTLCNRGTLTRTFTVFDCQGQTSSCTQQIVVAHDPKYAIRFPNDVVITACNASGDYGAPEIFGKGCSAIAVSFSDAILTVVPDACYGIERTWRIINWCDYTPGGACVQVPNPAPNAQQNHPDNLAGPVVSASGTLAPWASTVAKLTPGAAQATDFAVFWNPAVNCYEYRQIIKILDGQAPVVEQCPVGAMEIGDQTANSVELWNAPHWYDSTISSHNIADGPSELTITAADLCSKGNLQVRYLLFLDLDNNGTMETVVNSAAPPAANTVLFDNVATPNYAGGLARSFDGRPVPADRKYRFALETTKTDFKMTASVRWNTEAEPNVYVQPELPYGTHKVKWIVSDGCGNEQVCEYTFSVADTKPPTVVCIAGLGVNIMPSKTIELFAADFLQYAEDNYTPTGQLKFAVRRVDSLAAGFPYLPDGVTPQSRVVFDCTDLVGTQQLELWVLDAAGNADFCKTSVVVQDNAQNCTTNGAFATVAGTLKTETGDGIEDASVEISGMHPTLPPHNQIAMTDHSGLFQFLFVPTLGSYTVTPLKDNDPLNGVSTFDLVLINKHILGLEPLNSPYKMIAADANNSKSITTFDIVELRKLILGLYTDLPDNTSWRFVDEAFVFPNPSNPFQTLFPETTPLPDLSPTVALDQKFVAVKVGDVNGNAVTSSLTSTEDRTAGTLLFDVSSPTPALPDREGALTVKAGDIFTVDFKAAEQVQGYQFTLNHSGLELVDVTPGAEMSMANFGVFAGEQAVTTSWDGNVKGAFSLTFRATTSGDLSRMLGVSGRITKAEAYNVGGASAGWLPLQRCEGFDDHGSGLRVVPEPAEPVCEQDADRFPFAGGNSSDADDLRCHGPHGLHTKRRLCPGLQCRAGRPFGADCHGCAVLQNRNSERQRRENDDTDEVGEGRGAKGEGRVGKGRLALCCFQRCFLPKCKKISFGKTG
ncbi:MAG: HYR domain-containing protein [Lewinellaceae bacterium]|nr:HYR domain-containing protein [Lewinellaceae bacterium]